MTYKCLCSQSSDIRVTYSVAMIRVYYSLPTTTNTAVGAATRESHAEVLLGCCVVHRNLGVYVSTTTTSTLYTKLAAVTEV